MLLGKDTLFNMEGQTNPGNSCIFAVITTINNSNDRLYIVPESMLCDRRK